MPELFEGLDEGPSITVLIVHRRPDPHQGQDLQDHRCGPSDASSESRLEGSLDVKVVFEGYPRSRYQDAVRQGDRGEEVEGVDGQTDGREVCIQVGWQAWRADDGAGQDVGLSRWNINQLSENDHGGAIDATYENGIVDERSDGKMLPHAIDDRDGNGRKGKVPPRADEQNRPKSRG
jgi:hypothetical protein